MNPFWQSIINTLITAFGSSGFLAIVMYKIQRRDKKRDETKANDAALNQMVLGLCHDKIIYLTDKYIARGGITVREKATLESLYVPYRAGGGNGDCKTACEIVLDENFAILTEHEAVRRDLENKKKEFGITTEEENHV